MRQASTRAKGSPSLRADLDALAAPEWQSVDGVENAEKDVELTEQARAASTGSEAYAVAQQALWHNCPDALEVSLSVVRKEVELMEHKLRFTRIRQEFVELCRSYEGGGKIASFQRFRTCAEAIAKECAALIESQAPDQKHALPGLVTRRDSVLLQQRMKEIVDRIIRSAHSRRKARAEGTSHDIAGRDNSRRQRAPQNEGGHADFHHFALEDECQRQSSGQCTRSAALHQVHSSSRPSRQVRMASADPASCEQRSTVKVRIADRNDCASLTGDERTDLIMVLFSLLDEDGDDRLLWPEFRAFLSQIWREPPSSRAYMQLCKDVGVLPQEGVDLRGFAAVVDDEHVEAGCHCTNDELARLVSGRKAAAQKSYGGYPAHNGGA